MKKRLIWVFFIISLLILPVVFAANGYAGSRFSEMFQGVGDILGTVITLPSIGPNEGGEQPLTVIVGVFTMIFAIIYVVSVKLPMFRDTQHSGAIKAFALAFALIATFGTNLVNDVLMMVDFTEDLFFVLFWILIPIAFYILFHRGGAEVSKIHAEGAEVFAEADKKRLGAKKLKGEVDAEKKLIDDQRKSLNALRRWTRGIGLFGGLKSQRDLKKYLEDIKEHSRLIARIGNTDPHYNEHKKRIAQEVRNIMPIIRQMYRANQKRKKMIDTLTSEGIAGLNLAQQEHDEMDHIKEIMGHNNINMTKHNLQVAEAVVQKRMTDYQLLCEIYKWLDQIQTNAGRLDGRFFESITLLKQVSEQGKWSEIVNHVDDALSVLGPLVRLIGQLNEKQNDLEVILKRVKDNIYSQEKLQAEGFKLT